MMYARNTQWNTWYNCIWLAWDTRPAWYARCMKHCFITCILHEKPCMTLLIWMSCISCTIKLMHDAIFDSCTSSILCHASMHNMHGLHQLHYVHSLKHASRMCCIVHDMYGKLITQCHACHVRRDACDNNACISCMLNIMHLKSFMHIMHFMLVIFHYIYLLCI